MSKRPGEPNAMPTQAEIRRHCAEIRAGWSADEFLRRSFHIIGDCTLAEMREARTAYPHNCDTGFAADELSPALAE